MANEKKMTKREGYTALLAIDAVKENGALVAMIEHEIELLDKKNAKGAGKPTAKQVANEAIKTAIVNGMEVGKQYTITDIIKTIDGMSELTNQKVSSLMRQIVPTGAVNRVEDKDKTYFVRA